MWLDSGMSSRKHYNIDAILGWNAPHIHFTAEAIKNQPQPVERELTPYEEQLVRGGMSRQWVLAHPGGVK